MTSSRLSVLILAAWGAALLLPVAFAQAGSGPVIALPVGGVKPKSGLSMTIDCQGVDGNGYRPMRVEIRPLNGKPLPADRQLRLVLQPRSYTSSHSPEVSQIIELPEGSLVVTATIAMPQTGQWYGLGIETYEDGELLRDLSQTNTGWTGTNSWDWTEARPAMLLIDSQVPPRSLRETQIHAFRFQGSDPGPTYHLPDFRNLVATFPDPNRGGPSGISTGNKLSDVALLAQIAELTRFNLLPPPELPERWIELSQYDVVLVSQGDLRAMSKTHPKQLTAVSEWVAGGPLLIVSGVGQDFAGLAELEQLLSLPRLPNDPQTDAKFRGWEPADNDRHFSELTTELEDLESEVYDAGVVYPRRRIRRDTAPETKNKPGEPRPPVLPAPAQPPFAIRSIGLGKIVAIAAEQPFPGNETDWIWIFNSVPRNHWMWFQRNGFSMHRTNDDYWTMLIPGVGQAPVLSFVLLVSLFAVLIGPVNYSLLKRAKRLYLLLLTVPLGAAVVTGGLFAYALATDGLGVKLRARSFTELDQPSGRAVSWSRQSYYAAIAPSRGLIFPADATVYPLMYEPDKGNHSGSSQRALLWNGGQHLQTGYLASRTTTQFVVLRAARIPERLAVRTSAGKPPEATNHLGATVLFVLLRDASGNYWQGEKIGQDAAVTLSPTDLPTAAAQFHKFAQDSPLTAPHQYDPNEHRLNWDMSQRRYYGYTSDSGISQPLMAASLLEANLQLASRPTLEPPEKGTYLAVVESSPAVPYGVPRVREEASLHVIRGKY